MSRPDPTVSSSITEGVRVIVRSVYAPERSFPLVNRYVFLCSVRLENEGIQAAQVRSYRLLVRCSMGTVAHHSGIGVAGKQPVLRSGEHHEYSFPCVVPTTTAEMCGSYLLLRPNGRGFDATISPFRLAPPHSMN